YPAPQGRGRSGRTHAVTGAVQGLGQDRADGAVIVSEKYGFSAHLFLPFDSGFSSVCWRSMGRRTRNVVPRSREIHSTTPPWSRTIFATRARPRPLPWGFVVTKASKIWGLKS